MKSMTKKRVSPSSADRPWKKFVLYTILVTLCIVFFILKLPFINHTPAWDESVYLGMGKYIYSGGQSGLWEMIRPLGLPLVTGAFWSIGLDQIMTSRIFSLLVSAGMILMTFLIAKELFDRKYALLGAFIVASTPIFFYYSEYILTDHISTLLLMISIFFMIRERFALGAIFGGMAFWFKFTHILYFAAVMIYITYRTLTTKKVKDWKIQPKSIIFGVIMLGLIGAYFASNYILYHDHFDSKIDAISRPYTDASAYSDNPYQNTTFSDFKGFIQYISYYIYNIIFNLSYGSLIYIFAIIYLLDIKRCRHDPRHVLLGITFLVYLTYFTIIPYKKDRFLVTFIPFMAIYASYGMMRIMDYIKSLRPKIQGTKIQKILRISVLSMIIASSIISGYHISKFYGWNDTREKPDYDIERYFDIHNVDGPILTTDPSLTAYSDKRYVGAYDILNKNGLFVNDWESGTDFAAAIYSPDSIPCLEEDIRCQSNKAELFMFINKWFTPKDSYIYQGSNVTFYVEKNQ